MGLVLGTFVWLAGTVLLAITVQQLRRVNPKDRIPHFFGRPRNHPGEIYAIRAIALFLLLLSAQSWAEVLGLWSLLLILLAVVPASVLAVRHNRSVKEGQDGSNEL